MSTLLQRLLDRNRAPLSALQPVMPSVFAPSARTGAEAEPIAETGEPVENSTSFPPPSAPERTPGKMASTGEANSAASSPTVGEQPHPISASSAPIRPPPPAPQRKDTAREPAPVEKSFPGPAGSPPATGRPGIRQKFPGNGPVTKTLVPRDLARRAAPPIAKPGLISTNPPSEGRASPTPNPADAAEPKPAAKAERAKTMLASTLQWIAGQPLPNPGRPAHESPARPEATTEENISRASEPAASRRADDGAGSLPPMSRDPIPLRQAEGSAKKNSRHDEPAPPSVEVNVSIGHIEVKSAPSSPPPRRASARPRLTLEEFLKTPRPGGSR